MTNPAMIRIHLHDLYTPTTYGRPTTAQEVLDTLPITDSTTVATVLVGRSTPLSDDDAIFVHFTPLSDEQLMEWSEWGRGADVLLEFGGYAERDALMREVQVRWPDAARYEFPCLCCSNDDPWVYFDQEDAFRNIGATAGDMG